uniref:Uncharacterized protein n=1 Tax=Timema poppense TaxID=170557 RepID=A0A7R9CX08_TIMPO|nr:unnamed protein product [Timema poppensis]
MPGSCLHLLPHRLVDKSWNGNIRPFRFTTQKARRRTALPSELLYAGSAANDSTLQQEKMTDSLLMGPPRPVTRVPSVPDSLRTAVKPSPVAARKLYDRQESTSPRLNRRAYVMGPGSLMSKLTGSMEQGLDASPPNSPPTYRRLNSKEENVFSRLTSTTTGAKEEQIGKGIISAYTGKVLPKSPLMCTHVAEGHSRAVLSLFATDSLLFSASKDRTVKVWDLHSGVECQSLSGHPNNVVGVKYCEELRLVFSVSSAYVKVWDLRNNTNSSGLTTNGPISIATPSRSVILPAGEVTINDLALNHNGTTLYTAAGDRVRVWDIRKYECTGKLSGSHQAAVMCLAVGKVSDSEDLVVTGSKDHFIKVWTSHLITSLD